MVNGGRWQRRTTVAAEDNSMQDRAADYNREGQERVARESGDSRVAMLAAARKMAAADNDSGGGH